MITLRAGFVLAAVLVLASFPAYAGGYHSWEAAPLEPIPMSAFPPSRQFVPRDVNVYDWQTGYTNRLTIESIRRQRLPWSGRSTDVEVFDWGTLTFQTFTVEEE